MDCSLLEKPYVKEKYTILGRLGSGTYGTVYLAKPIGASDKEDCYVAVKVMNKQKEGKYDSFTTINQLREIKFIKELHHPNIVRQVEVLYNYSIKESAIVFEHADYDLHDFIKCFNTAGMLIPFPIIRNFMWQIISATAYLHSNWVMHRDLKPTNLLIMDNATQCGVIKVTDFGLARSFQEPLVAFSELEKVVVTLWYRAPELLLGCKSYGPAVDMWAIGCIFAKMLNLRDLFCGDEVHSSTDRHPFQSNQCEKVFSILGLPSIYEWPELKTADHYMKISRWGFDKNMGTQSKLQNCVKRMENNSDAYDLLRQLLVLNPSKRITAAEALNHPFFTRGDSPCENALPPKAERNFTIPPKMGGQAQPDNMATPTTPTSSCQLNVLY
ncbi:hypothetical protein WA577_004653 [Blastocystis sp. JDR]